MVLPHRKHPRLKQFDYSSNGGYFITICTKNRRHLFGHIILTDSATAIMELSPLGKIIKTYIESIPASYSGICVDHYVIMPNHIHLLLRFDMPPVEGGQGSGRPTVMTVVHALKRLTAKQAGYAIWQKSFHEHIIRNEKDYLEIWNYIENNPGRWADDTYFS